MIGSDIIDIGSDVLISDPILVRKLWPGPLNHGRSSRVGLEQSSSQAEPKSGRARAGPSSSEVALGLEREVCPRQAREQGHFEQGHLERGLTSLEAEGEVEASPLSS